MEHNYAGEVALTRDTFLSSELDYLKQLAEIPDFIELYRQYKGANMDKLSERLMTLIQKMENGEISEEEEQKTELEIMCCCLAIEAAIKTKGSKVLTPEKKEDMTYGRSR